MEEVAVVVVAVAVYGVVVQRQERGTVDNRKTDSSGVVERYEEAEAGV